MLKWTSESEYFLSLKFFLQTLYTISSPRDLLSKGSVKHDAMSNSLLKEGMLPYHRTAAITACIIITYMAIPLTRAIYNRLAAVMKELQPYSHPSCEAPCGYALVYVSSPCEVYVSYPCPVHGQALVLECLWAQLLAGFLARHHVTGMVEIEAS